MGLVAVTAVLAVVGQAAAATPPLTPVAESVTAPVTDGERYVGLQSPTGTTRVLDTWTGGWREVPTPSGCTSRYGTQGVVAVGGGQLLWDCGYSAARLLDLATGAIHEPAGLGSLGRDASSRSFHGVGRSWIAGTESGYHWNSTVLVNWRTGEIRRGVPVSPRRVADLDLAQLERRLCRPLRRGRNQYSHEFDLGPPYADYQYERPSGLTLRGPSGEGPDFVAVLILDRCGRKGRRLVSRCPGSCWDPLLSEGILTWAEPRGERAVVSALRLATGGKRRWVVGAHAGVTHTRTQVVVWDPRTGVVAMAPLR